MKNYTTCHSRYELFPCLKDNSKQSSNQEFLKIYMWYTCSQRKVPSTQHFLFVYLEKFKSIHASYFRGYVRDVSISKLFIEANIIKAIKIWTKWELLAMSYDILQANALGDHIYVLFLYN